MIDLQFLKVRDWSIKFRYHGQVYVIKDCSDGYDSILGLFKFSCDEHGYYEMELLGYAHYPYFVGSFSDSFVDRRKVYAHMDKVGFLHDIIECGFAELIHIDYCDLYR